MPTDTVRLRRVLRTSPGEISTGSAHSFGGRYLELVQDQTIRYTDTCDDPSLPAEMRVTASNMFAVFYGFLFSLGLGLACPVAAQVQSHVFVKNETQQAIHIRETELGGAAVSAKAWSQGAQHVAPGERGIVLTINRKGKVNWMDPTPRFLEPGKELVFSTLVVQDGPPQASAVLLQKLLGTGDATKMWYSVGAPGREQEWYMDDVAPGAGWKTAKSARWVVDFRSFAQDGETHLEYVFRQVP